MTIQRYKNNKRSKEIEEEKENILKVNQSISIIDYYNTHIVGVLKNQKFSYIAYTQMSETKGGICPLHDETDASFHYWKGKNKCHCFGCDRTVDVIGLHQTVLKRFYNKVVSYIEAMRDLAKIYNIELNEKRVIQEQEREITKEEKRQQRLQEMYKDIDKAQKDIECSNILEKYSLLEYIKENKKLIQNDYPINAKIKNFEILDCIATVNNIERNKKNEKERV